MKIFVPLPKDATPEEIVKILQAARRRQKLLHGGPVNPRKISKRNDPTLVRVRKSGFAPTVHIDEMDADKNLVFGWANVSFTADGQQVSDLQGHSIDIDDLEEAAYNFAINYHTSGDMHTGEAFGDMVETMVFTPEKVEALGLEAGSVPLGWWVGYKLPPEHFRKVKSGERKMYSIQGKARLELID